MPIVENNPLIAILIANNPMNITYSLNKYNPPFDIVNNNAE